MDVVVHSHKRDEKQKKSKKSEKKKKRKRSRSTSSDSSDRTSSKTKKKKSKKSKKKTKHNEKESLPGNSTKTKHKTEPSEPEEDYGIPLELMNTKAKAPESREEYEKRQSIIRKVYDEETGRHRLIRGDGEVIEEIVSKKTHEEINKTATQSDGSTFQNRLGLNK